MKFSLDLEVIMLIIIISILITYKNLEKLRKLSQQFQYQLHIHMDYLMVI